jgi:hypothetical protein
MQTSDLIADAKEALGDMRDLVQTWTAVGGTPSWQVIIGQPMISQGLDAGGYTEVVSHEVRVVAESSSWTTAYGTACAAALSSGQPVSQLAIGKILVATEQASRRYRVMEVGFKPGSAWVVLRVRAEDQR